MKFLYASDMHFDSACGRILSKLPQLGYANEHRSNSYLGISNYNIGLVYSDVDELNSIQPASITKKLDFIYNLITEQGFSYCDAVIFIDLCCDMVIYNDAITGEFTEYTKDISVSHMIDLYKPRAIRANTTINRSILAVVDDFTDLVISIARNVFVNNIHRRSLTLKLKLHVKYTVEKTREDEFVKRLLAVRNYDYLLLAGDFYANLQKSIDFVNRLERLHINGFFVLGHYDTYNKPEEFSRFKHTSIDSYTEAVNICKDATSDNTHFKFLYNGVSFNIGEFLIIGDIGYKSGIDLHEPKWWRFLEQKMTQHDNMIVLTHIMQNRNSCGPQGIFINGGDHNAFGKTLLNERRYTNPYCATETFSMLTIGG